MALKEEVIVQDKQSEFMALYAPNHDRLSRFIQSMVWNREDAKDILSETILITFDKFESIRNKDSLRCYMFSVASNLTKKYRSKSKMKVVLEEGHLEKQNESGNTIYDKLAVGELYDMMKQLPSEQKEALTMYEISGLSMEDISIIQGGTLSGVKSRIARARQKLLEILNKSEIVKK